MRWHAEHKSHNWFIYMYFWSYVPLNIENSDFGHEIVSAPSLKNRLRYFLEHFKNDYHHETICKTQES